MTAALIVSLVLNIALLVSLFLIAVLFSRTLADTVSLVDRVHTRAVKHDDSLLDRIMAADWHSFRAAQLEDLVADEGGQIFPSSGDEGEMIVTQLTDEELRQMAQERTLLTEDFPDEDR
jgi:hypothetical protein